MRRILWLVILAVLVPLVYGNEVLPLQQNYCDGTLPGVPLHGFWNTGVGCIVSETRPGYACHPTLPLANEEVRTTVKDQCVLYQFYKPMSSVTVNGACTPITARFYVYLYYWD